MRPGERGVHEALEIRPERIAWFDLEQRVSPTGGFTVTVEGYVFQGTSVSARRDQLLVGRSDSAKATGHWKRISARADGSRRIEHQLTFQRAMEEIAHLFPTVTQFTRIAMLATLKHASV